MTQFSAPPNKAIIACAAMRSVVPTAAADQIVAPTPRQGLFGSSVPTMEDDARTWSGQPVFRVERPVMTQGWKRLAAIHWRTHPSNVQAKLPPGLTPDEFDGSAWVGLIPFHMVKIAPGSGPAIPYLGTFPETNVRTYVTGAAGPGIWFNSLDISRLIPVMTARTTYRLPYMWAKMKITQHGQRIEYHARRRWPGPRGARSHVAIEWGEQIVEPSQLEHFLSARWGLYTMLGTRLSFAKVEHEPWPLHRASVTHLDDQMLEAAGFTQEGSPHHVMYSPGVSVRIERPRFVALE